MEYLEIDQYRIAYQLSKASANRVSLRFAKQSACLIIECPGGKMTQGIKGFVDRKSNWIVRQYLIQNRILSNRKTFLTRLGTGEVLYQGQWIPYHTLVKSERSIAIRGGQLYLSISAKDQQISPKVMLYSGLYAHAKAFLQQKTLYWAEQTHSSINNIRIKDIVSRWGSCSNKGNINLNWHLIFLPTTLIEYVIIHELMHLREMNHSARFWNHVASYVPDYKQKDKLLDTYRWVIGILND